MTRSAAVSPMQERMSIPSLATPRAVARPDLVAMPLSSARLAGATARRVATGIPELDRVLGGGVVDGSVILIGGDPGVGKSTLLMQAVNALARGGAQKSALYASGEESVQQVALRAERLGIWNEQIAVVATDDVDQTIDLATRTAPAVLVIDSIQKMRTLAIDSFAGSVAQVAECTARLARFAKQSGTPVVLVGQVTKDGAIAGPKSMEHDVDVVLYFEQGRGARRQLVTPKNRYGSTDEVGLFEMRESGLACVEDASAGLSERAAGVPGSAVFPAVIGERVQLVEIQALVGPAKLDERPKGTITVSGIDPKRVQMILAILAKHAAIDVSDRDVFVSVTAGARVTDPAADLPIALAIASSVRDLPIDPSAVCFGELGLAGEVRSVVFARSRASESRRAGFAVAIASATDAADAPHGEASGAKNVGEAIALVIGEAVAS